MNPEKFDEAIKKMPIIETRIRKSKDGNYVIHKTIITDIKPMSYYEKVFQEAVVEEEED